MKLRHVTIVAALAAVCVLGATAAPARALGTPQGWPDLSAAVVQTADLGAAAQVEDQAYVKPDSSSLAEYDREFTGATVNGKKLLAAEDDVSIHKSAGTADSVIQVFPLTMVILEVLISKQIAKDLGVKPTYTKAGKPAGLGIGSNSAGGVIRLGTKSGEIRVVVGIVRVQQVNSVFVMFSRPRSSLGIADAKQFARIAFRRTVAAMTPQNTVVPVASGTAAIGQVLTSTPGTWLGFPTTYTYQWQRCDATGANCAVIAGATTASYTVSTDDAGATLRVVVGAQNAFGIAATTVSSAQTVAVPAVAPPTTTTG